MHHLAVDVLTRLGGDPTDFAARQLTPRIATDADLVLTMTAVQRDAVLELAPRQLRKTFTLGEAALLTAEYSPHTIADLAALRPHLADHRPAEVPDPIGLDPDMFEAVGQQIAILLPPVLALCRYASTPPTD